MYQNQNRLNRYREQANGYHGEKDEGSGKIGVWDQRYKLL